MIVEYESVALPDDGGAIFAAKASVKPAPGLYCVKADQIAEPAYGKSLVEG